MKTQTTAEKPQVANLVKRMARARRADGAQASYFINIPAPLANRLDRVIATIEAKHSLDSDAARDVAFASAVSLGLKAIR